MKKDKTKSWWKKLSYPLAGAIIGGIGLLAIIWCFTFFSNIIIRAEWLEYILMFIAKSYTLIIGCKRDCNSVYIIIMIIILLFGALMGALLALVIKKIVNKIRKNKNYKK